ncbi:hypothetical protein B0I18_1011070 [Taibaiella chishuiensis]|uniref:Uncharacterized protein n=1 Tax=Taibaiella chishuiensis TaxID=1434707 RepID=A0A2P8DCK0_9BACT|nr:hypothetical protein B0I18_1011070 [Taibaiella chishuiensis]
MRISPDWGDFRVPGIPARHILHVQKRFIAYFCAPFELF